jgi:YesN/AraC family two-component response regulator
MEKESKQIARLKGVLQYVAQSYQEPISLKTAADIASLNQEYFCRMFKKCMGVTFLEYINLVRIDHIHDELLVTDDSITDILERNGFTNYKVFSRMFKAQFGMTPRELRRLRN